jgi:hypothetical protein
MNVIKKIINWRFVIFVFIGANIASYADGDFVNYKMNFGIIIMCLLAYIYKIETKRFE